MTDATDTELLDRARQGDQVAFRHLVTRYERVVAATVIGMLGPGDEADEVGQDTFVRFHAALDQFRGEASLATYLRRIAMNLSLNELKRRRRWTQRFVSRDEAPASLREPPVDAVDPEVAERRAAVQAAIGALGARHRPVVVLRLIEGLSTQETAETLGVPAGTVLSRLARAMAQLERALGPYVRQGLRPGKGVPRDA